MNYATQASVEPIPQIAVLPSITKNWSDQLDRQIQTIGRIEGKLHDIVNLRKPEVKEAMKQGSIGDFVQAGEANLQRMYDMSNRLDEIEAHLFKII